MEAITTNVLKHPTEVAGFAANDNHRPDPRLTPSPFPTGARGVIFRPARSAMTSGKTRSGGWRLTFERRSAPYVEPLMGWTADDDPLAQVELSFPTLRSAIRYAEQQGLPYTVQASRPEGADRLEVGPAKLTRAFSDATLERLGLGDLQGSYVDAVAGAEARHDPGGEKGWASPMAVANDAALSIEAKRAILIRLGMDRIPHRSGHQGGHAGEWPAFAASRRRTCPCGAGARKRCSEDRHGYAGGDRCPCEQRRA